MVTYKNMLFCTDFSANAQAALPHAIDLAKKYGATLHVVHVYQEPEHVAEFEISSNHKIGLDPGGTPDGNGDGEETQGAL